MQPPEPADLVALTATLVAIPSVSGTEQELADWVTDRLGRSAHLAVERIGDTVVARTEQGRPQRLLLAGHLDTVPPVGTGPVEGAVVEGGSAVRGLGAVDMKGGLAVLLDLAASVVAPAVDVTYVFYPCEEVARAENGLVRLAAERPEVLAGTAAVLAEPTAGRVEAGCQGTARARVVLRGRRAHTARPWTGRNAVHRLGPVLEVLAGFTPRTVELAGCRYQEQLQAVAVSGGVAGNVVPDEASVTVNFRFAPDRDEYEAEAVLASLFEPLLDPQAGDQLVVEDIAGGAPPALDQPLLAQLVTASGMPPVAKVGWTDVATFAAAGVPATNFGPGDPLLAHTPDEQVGRAELDAVRAVLAAVLEGRATVTPAAGVG